MTDFAIDNTRKTINALRAYYGAGPTAMTDEQIEEGCEVYGAKKHVDMVTIDETDVLDYQGVRPPTDDRTTELQSLSKLKKAGKLRYWRGTIEIPENELQTICDEIQAEHDQAIAATLGNGTLTAGQVRDAIKQHSMWVIGNNRCFRDGAYEEIAGELNAALGSGTCNPEETETITYYDEYGHDTVKVHVMECDECGGTYEHVYGEYERCPRCGRKAVELDYVADILAEQCVCERCVNEKACELLEIDPDDRTCFEGNLAWRKDVSECQTHK